MLVDVLAGRDRSGGEADDLAELADRLALGDFRVATLWLRGIGAWAVIPATSRPAASVDGDGVLSSA